MRPNLILRYGHRRRGARRFRCRGPALGRRSRLLTRYTHWQLASIIGANREATTRAMRQLRERGAIEVEGRRIRVTDREALERVAEDGETS